MIRKKSMLFLIFTLVLLGGCQRGCTTRSTMRKESVTVKRRKQDVLLTARVIDARNSRRTGKTIFDRTITHTYALRFDVATNGYSMIQFYWEPIFDDPETVDLAKQLVRIKVSLSKDKKHIGLGVDDKVVDVIHLYRNHRVYALLDSSLIVSDKWSDLDIESYPEPVALILASLREKCQMATNNTKDFHFLLDSYRPSDTIHRMLLSKWPDCNAVVSYLDKARVKKLVKNIKWKSYAVTRGREVFEQDDYFFKEEEVFAFLGKLHSKKLDLSIDSVLASKWGTGSNSEITEMVMKRMKSSTNPLSPHYKKEILNEASALLSEFHVTKRANHHKDLSTCLKILIQSGDTTSAELVLNNGFTGNYRTNGIYDFIDLVYDNYDDLTPYQRKTVKKETVHFFEEVVPHYVKSILFDAVKDIMECDQLKKWKKDYAEDLEHSELSERCGGPKDLFN